MAATRHERAALQRELERPIRHVLELSRSRKRFTGKTIHEIRKALKRVRTVLRLVRDAIGKGEYAHENALLRDAGRALRAVRDADVILGVITDLKLERTRHTSARTQSLRHAQTRKLRSHVSQPLEEARHRIHKWRLPYEMQPITHAGLERLYRKARKAAKLARSKASDPSLHEARKQAKYLATALDVLQPTRRRAAKLKDRAAKVAKALGDDHDLALALPALPRQRDAKRPRKTIRRKRAKLQHKALKRAAKLYKRKPKAFVKQVAP